MFTGLIEEIGYVENVVFGAKSCKLKLRCKCIFDDLKIGDSVAVNGTCLTVCSIENPCFTVDIMAETMRNTNIGGLKHGSAVNIERAMMLNGRFGGHIVSGHIDGTGTILNMTRDDNAVVIAIGANADIMRYIVHKGSVTLDGISLTVSKAKNTSFEVSIIPHTGEATTLLERKPGYKINIECDIIGKYVEKLTSNKSSGITLEYLKENGF